MRRWHTAILTSAVVAALAGCSSSGGSQGGEGQPCYPNRSCNDGLVCLSNLCVRPPAGGAGAGGGGGTNGRGGSGGSVGSTAGTTGGATAGNTGGATAGTTGGATAGTGGSAG